MKILKDFKIELDDKEILRLLQNKQNDSKLNKPSEKTLQDIHEMKQLAKPLIKPRGVFDVFDSRKLKPRFMFIKSEQSVLAICSIGEELEILSRNYLKEGELAKGVILDAIASHAAEQTAEQFNQKIIEEIKDIIKDKQISCRFSPGYCQWQLEKGQEQIFSLLDGDKINVSLSPSKMMIPVKSVSFAINIGKEVDHELGLRGCETCDMENCAYRRV